MKNKPEYINKEVLLERLDIENALGGHYGISLTEINKIPAADVVERKTGTWCADYDGYADGEPVYDMWWCSACGEYFDEWDDRPTWNFCPNCGCAMEG